MHKNLEHLKKRNHLGDLYGDGDNIKVDFRVIVCRYEKCVQFVQNRVKWWVGCCRRGDEISIP
jgi:hypothetical protein